MAAALRHRGPDDEGYFEDPEASVYLANRRLSILDPEGGHQPVRSEDGAVVAVHNGEIYNFQELRTDLEKRGHRLRSRSDAEVIPHLYEEHGEAFPELLDGMFSIALWDAKRRKLVLARDHVGIKPLYVWRAGEALAFASEVKGLLALDSFRPELDFDSLHFLLNIRFVPGRRSLFKGVDGSSGRTGRLARNATGSSMCPQIAASDAPRTATRRRGDC
jgi:asparagine synthase (glutamine-hydrolysing)